MGVGDHNKTIYIRSFYVDWWWFFFPHNAFYTPPWCIYYFTCESTFFLHVCATDYWLWFILVSTPKGRGNTETMFLAFMFSTKIALRTVRPSDGVGIFSNSAFCTEFVAKVLRPVIIVWQINLALHLSYATSYTRNNAYPTRVPSTAVRIILLKPSIIYCHCCI